LDDSRLIKARQWSVPRSSIEDRELRPSEKSAIRSLVVVIVVFVVGGSFSRVGSSCVKTIKNPSDMPHLNRLDRIGLGKHQSIALSGDFDPVTRQAQIIDFMDFLILLGCSPAVLAKNDPDV
jgi:hypothetical protein